VNFAVTKARAKDNVFFYDPAIQLSRESGAIWFTYHTFFDAPRQTNCQRAWANCRKQPCQLSTTIDVNENDVQNKENN